MHGVPTGAVIWQVEFMQAYPVAHWALVEQLVGQVASVPSQVKAPQLGWPADPARDGLHCPTSPTWLQLSQLPVQAALQHTPSAQEPDTHWSLAEQVEPSTALITHVPFRQYAVDAH